MNINQPLTFAMLSFGLGFDKPRRITKESGRLINNMFTDVHNHTTSDLFLNDISYHLPLQSCIILRVNVQLM